MKKLLALLLICAIATLSTGCFVDLSDKIIGGDDDKTIEAKKPELSRGTFDGNVYESEFLGLKFTKPESWVYSTDEEISAAMGYSADILGENIKQAFENNTVVYDMMVRDTLSGTNINISYEDLAKSLATNITEKQYIEAVKQQFANVEGMTVTFSDEIETVKLGDCDFTRVICSSSIYGVEMTQVYYIRKIENYMSNVIVTIVSDLTIEDIEAMFE